MYYNTELEEFVEQEYKDYNFNDIQANSLKKDDIQNTIKQFMTDLINNIKNNLDFSDTACLLLKIFALFTIGILCLLAYLLNYFLNKLLAYLMNLLDKIIKAIMDKIKEILNAIFDKIKEILDMINKTIEEIKNMILQIVSFIENLIAQLIALIESIVNALLTILDRFFEFINNLIAWLLNCLSIPDLPNCLSNIDAQLDNNIGINEPVNDPNFNDIADDNYTSLPIIDEIINDINNTKAEIQNSVSDTISSINKINNLDDGISILNNMVDSVQNQLTNLVDNINNNLRNNLINYDVDLYNNLYNLTDEDYNNMNNILDYFNNTLDNIINDNMPYILNDLEKQLITGEIC